MEKRLLLFVAISVVIWGGFLAIDYLIFGGRKPAPEVALEGPADPSDPQLEAKTDGDEPPEEENPEETDPDPADEPQEPGAEENDQPEAFYTLGSIDPASPFKLLATFTNRGAAISRLELNDPNFRSLEEWTAFPGKRPASPKALADSGYLGNLALSLESAGCRVNVVGPGTPAAGRGGNDSLQIGDLLLTAEGMAIETPSDLRRALAKTSPGDKVEVEVLRNNQPRSLSFTLAEMPLQLIEPQYEVSEEGELKELPPSLLFTLESLGRAENRKGAKVSIKKAEEEILGLPSLKNGIWESRSLTAGARQGIEFRFALSPADLKKAGATGELVIFKRYWLEPGDDNGNAGYHLSLEIEVKNASQEEQHFAYRLDGPNGLPLEGWWYANKIQASWGAAGARDVAYRLQNGTHKLFTGPYIYKLKSKETTELSDYDLFQSADSQTLQYVGVDTQYFTTVLLPAQGAEEEFRFARGLADNVGKIDKRDKSQLKTVNTTFRLISPRRSLAGGESFTQKMVLFAGPKKPELLEHYEMNDYISYGWPIFTTISKLMIGILHVLESFVGNYGLAIILLTVLVRGCMFPLGRRAAKNAQKMQELAPEMKRISEKYKDDMQKRAEALRELYAAHNHNPFGGCLPMLIQLPIFLGLYRGLTVDIALRQQPLIPGMSWCSNLAGPDALYYWENVLPQFLAGPYGYLGPYLNILPLITIGLFLLQQKLFMPPATDEQTKMQQQMMTIMMVFFGIMFFKVPSGLCIYFITSSIWGIAERKLLPKTKLDKDGKPILEDKGVKPAPKPERRKKPDSGKDRPKRKSRK